MMKQRIKLDWLLLFLMISISSLVILNPEIKSKIWSSKTDEIKQFQPFEKIVSFPESFVVGSKDSIYAYDPDYDLFYSVDGGDEFLPFKVLHLSDVALNSIGHYDFSIRSKSPLDEQPELKSILVKGKHKTAPIYLESKQLTYCVEQVHNLPIISLIVSEEGLVSNRNGILVLGQDHWFDSGFTKPFWEQRANYKRRGQASKKKVRCQYINKSRVEASFTCHIQVSGNATRAFPQKSFKLKANRAFGTAYFEFPFFKGGLKKYQSLVIRNSGNDNTKTLFADLMMHRLAKKTKVLTQKGFPVVVYLNGNYWGIYNLRERIDLHLIAKHEGKTVNEITILEGGAGELKDGKPEEQKAFIDLVESIGGKEKLDADGYQLVKSKIKMKSFIDYIFLETFYANGDWLHNNAIWYKAGGKKWRWVLNDLDYGLTYLGAQQVEANLFDYLSESGAINAKLFRALMTNSKFKENFKKRANKQLEKHFNESEIQATFTKLQDKIYNEIPNHIKRWRGQFNRAEWQANCQANLNFLLKRRKIYQAQIEAL